MKLHNCHHTNTQCPNFKNPCQQGLYFCEAAMSRIIQFAELRSSLYYHEKKYLYFFIVLYDWKKYFAKSLVKAWQDHAADVVNIKISKFGGITRAKEAIEFCTNVGLAMTIEDTWGGELPSYLGAK